MNMQINQKGQSLLEIAVLIGVIIIVVVGMVSTIVYGLKNSQLSKNSVQATKYAQEGLEIMRTIKSRNCKVVQGGATYRWNSPAAGESLIWNIPQNNYYVTSFNLSPCEVQLNTNSSLLAIGSEQIFTREIVLSTIGVTNQLKVSSRVVWTDPSGTHESNIATIFATY